jgi:hypothetical protein
MSEPFRWENDATFDVLKLHNKETLRKIWKFCISDQFCYLKNFPFSLIGKDLYNAC